MKIFWCITIFLLNFTNAEKISCDEEDKNLIDKIAEWSRTLPILVKQDEQRLKNFAEFEPIDDVNELRDYYYR